MINRSDETFQSKSAPVAASLDILVESQVVVGKVHLNGKKTVKRTNEKQQPSQGVSVGPTITASKEYKLKLLCYGENFRYPKCIS